MPKTRKVIQTEVKEIEVSQKKQLEVARYKFTNIVYKIDLHTKSKDNHFSPKKFFLFNRNLSSFNIKFKIKCQKQKNRCKQKSKKLK
jgi:hypothetical protein